MTRYAVELEAVGGAAWAGAAPPVVRLRRLAKAALRSYGFRVVAVAGTEAAAGPLLNRCASEPEGAETLVAAEDCSPRYRREGAAAHFSPRRSPV